MIIRVATLAELFAELDARGIQGDVRTFYIHDFLSRKMGSYMIPQTGVLELTPFCNLDCKMCYVHLRPDQLPQQSHLLSVDQWKEIIRQAVDAGMMTANLTGGECLTYPGFREVYRYLADLGVRVIVLTNGRMLTDDMVELFSQFSPAMIRVTVYGSDENAYERVTGHRAFTEVMDGITRVRAAGLKCKLSITPNRFMEDDLEELFRLVSTMGLDYGIGEIAMAARPETGREVHDYAMGVEAYVRLKKLYKNHIQALRGGKTTLASKTEGDEPVVFLPPEREKRLGLPCGAGRSLFHVNWKGDLLPCAGFDTVSANILEHSFKIAWADVQRQVEAFRLPAECEKCELRERCQPCPCELMYGKLDGPINSAVCQRKRRFSEERLATFDMEC